jgi:hydrophobe/amphiphile efflux-1 (HAE1) family protein
MNITKISIEKPKLVVVLFTLIIFLGVVSYFYLSYELTPKFTPPVITVTTVYPGASPVEVENNVSKKIEDALSSLENIETISSISQENFSLIRLEMVPGTDIDKSVQSAARNLQAAANTLPEAAEAPSLNRFDFDDLPVMRIGAFSDLDPVAFYDFALNYIEPELARLEGVAQVRLIGGRPREISVLVDPQKLLVYGVPLMSVVQAVQMGNLDVPAGRVENERGQTFVRLSGKVGSIKELEDLVVFQNVRMGIKVRLGQVAEILDTQREAEAITRINGRYALGIDVKKQSDANAVDMSQLVRERLDFLAVRHSEMGLSFEIAQDTSLFTIEAANAVMTDLGYAVLLVSLIMLLFLHSLRNSLIVLVSIPTSIISTFIVMYLLNYSLNLLSLLGLSLAIGILVDDSIVVVENIYRHIEMKKSRVRAAYEGRVEIGFTAISITLIDVVVFLPIVFAQGMVADLLRQFSVVVVTSTLMSLFVSFTLVPLLASRFAKLERINASTIIGNFLVSFEQSIDRFINLITDSLKWAFGHKTVTLLVAMLLLTGALSLVYFGFIGIEFTRAGDRSEFIIELELPKDATLQQTNQVALQVEQYLRSKPEVASVFSSVGITSMGRIEASTSNLAELSIRLIDKNERSASTAVLARMIKLELEGNIPGLKLRPVEINLIGLRDDDDVQVTINGADEEILKIFAFEVERVLDGIPGVIEIQSSAGEVFTEYNVMVNRKKMEALGVSLAQVGGVMRTAFSGNRDAKYRDNDLDYDINIIVDPMSRRNSADIDNLTVINNMGKLVRLGQFVEIGEDLSMAKLERTNRSSSITIKSQVVGRPAGTVGSELKKAMKGMEVPDGITYEFGGQTKRTTDGIRTMMLAFAISVLLVYLILVALYDSYYYPFVVLFSIPLAVIGALLALALTQQALSIFSILGMVILIGLVGKNAILVVDFTNNLKARGMELKDALIEATRLRFRPILMTNMTMVIGLLPIALARGAGSEWKNGLAWALIGGLSSSMLLTLVIVPVIYYIFDTTLEKYGIQWGKKVKVPKEHYQGR